MLKYAFIELKRRKRRTIAAVSGYMVAIVFFSIILNALIESKNASSLILKSTGTHFIAYLPLCSDQSCEMIAIDNKNEGFYADTIKTQIFEGSIIETVKQFDAVKDASPFILFKIRLKLNNITDTFMLGGIPLNNSISVSNNSCSESNIVAGKFLDSADTSSILLEEGFSKRNYLFVGSNIEINNKKFNVKGIVNSGIKPVKADFYLPIDQARDVVNSRLLNPMKDRFNIILVESLNSQVHQESLFQVKNLLGSRGIVSSYGCYKPAAAVLGINETGVWLVTVIIFLGILGFSLRSQYSSIIERRYEIGILKVTGWNNNDILKELFYESIIQSFIGWFAGSILAISINIFISLFYYKSINILLYLTILFYSLIFSVTGGIIAGIIPGLSASKLKIADCLRRL